MIRIFTDFDGTITRRDVGDAFFEHFGGLPAAEAVEKYLAEEISAVECFRRECEACGIVDLNDLHAFLDRQEIDDTFVEFVSFCRREQLALTVVSDGMDYYISRILRRYGVGDVPSVANTLELVPTGAPSRVKLVPHFLNRDEMCDRCASCKRNHLLTASADDDIIVYIGEGYSDRCPARYADVVFAKDRLRKYCREENIAYYEYQSFSDIADRLTNLLRRRRPDGLRKRRQAELARRDIFIGG